MLFKDLRPFVRFSQILSLNEKSTFGEVVALDARLFFVESGKAKILSEGKEYLLEKEDLFLINSGIPYKICPAREETTVLQINFDYDCKADFNTAPICPIPKDAFRKELLVNFITFEDCPCLAGILHLRGMAILQKRLHAVIREFSLRFAYSKEKMSNLLSDCIIDAVRAERMIFSTGEERGCTEVIAFIHENYQEPLTNASIAERFNYHPVYMSDLIKRATGLSLHRYLIHVRLMRAVPLLQNTALSINEIAIACGFCDAAHFCGHFKRAFRTNPSKFRSI